MRPRILASLALGLTALNATAAEYRIIQITYNAYDDYKPQINDTGQMAWIENRTGLDPGLGDNLVFRDSPEAPDTILPSDRGRVSMYDLNEVGAVAWPDKEVYFFDGTTITQFTTSGHTNMDVHLNNSNHIIWNQRVDDASDVYWYDGSGITPLTNYPATNGNHPWINDNGDTVWMAASDLVQIDQVVLNDININTIPHLNGGARFNDSGQVVWIAGYEDSNDALEVFLYTDGVTDQLTDDERADLSAQINASGQVAWVGGYWSVQEIMLFDGVVTKRISDPGLTSQYNPQINNNGWVVWNGYDGEDHEVFVYDGVTRTQVTEDTVDVGFCAINNLGMIVWQQQDEVEGDYEIFLGIPMTDCNGNGIPDECDLDCAATVDVTGELCSLLFPACGGSTDSDGDGVMDECEAPVPAVSTWGMLAMVLLTMTAGTIAFRGRAKRGAAALERGCLQNNRWNRLRVLVVPAFLLVAGSASADVGQMGVEVVGQWGGVNWRSAVVGNTAYIGVGPRLVILDVSGPSDPIELGRTDVLPGVVDDIMIEGSHAYLSTWHRPGLLVVDVSDSSSPTLVAEYETIARVDGIDIVSGMIYIAEQNLLEIAQIVGPTTLLYRSDIATVGSTYDVTVVGNVAYVADGNDGGLRLFDVSDPDAPTLLGAYDSDHEVVDVVVSAGYAYIADYPASLLIVDVSDPTDPQFCSEYAVNGAANGIDLVGNTAYLGARSQGLHVFDVTDPCNPIRCGGYNPGGLAAQVLTIADLVYLSDYRLGLHIVDVAGACSGVAPQRVGGYEASNAALKVVVQGDLAYVADWYAGVQIVDISDPTSPTRIHTHSRWQTYDVDVEGNVACLATWNGNAYPVDLTSPTAPVECTHYDTGGNNQAVTLENSIAYVGNVNPSELYIVDLSGDCGSAPSLCDVVAPGDHPLDTEVQGDHAYVAEGGVGLEIYDVHDVCSGGAAVSIGVCDTSGSSVAVAVDGDHAYVADASNGLVVVDVSDVANPVQVGHVATGDTTYDVATSGDLVFVANHHSGLAVIDVADPEAPVLVAEHETPGPSTQGVAVAGDNILLADGYGGLLIVRAFPDCNGNNIEDAEDISEGTSSDCNSNSIPDDCELDTDGDTVIDACDTDDDNDCVSDGSDSNSLDPLQCEDMDGDGCDDCSVGVDGFGALCDNRPADDGVDTDADGLCDVGDPCTDVDGDGWGQDVGNGIDCPNGATPDCDDEGSNATDPDVDNVCEPIDNCNLYNPDQLDCQPNSIGDVCDIDAGTSPDQDDDGTPDECEFGPPQPEPEPEPVCKNRYISFVPDHADVPTALHVEITASELFPDSVGTAGWVGTPDEDGVSRIVVYPVYRVWPEPLVNVGDCMIAPTVTYEITAVVGPTPEIRSDALIVDTIAQPSPKYWCDVVGEFVAGAWTPPNGIVNMNDIMAVLQGFSSAPTARPIAWLDLDPEVPNTIINMTDVQRAVSAFKGEPYSFSDPGDCPYSIGETSVEDPTRTRRATPTSLGQRHGNQDSGKVALFSLCIAGWRPVL